LRSVIRLRSRLNSSNVRIPITRGRENGCRDCDDCQGAKPESYFPANLFACIHRKLPQTRCIYPMDKTGEIHNFIELKIVLPIMPSRLEHR
jgi:hypothetical protein